MIATILVLAAVAALVGIDQWIKVWAIHNLCGKPDRVFLRLGSLDWMHLHFIENDGAAFSMLSGSRSFLIVFPIVIILFCVYLLHRKGRAHRWLYVAIPLIIAGGVGNLIDRIFRGGAVVDYFQFQLFNFAVFNFADCCITTGVLVMVIGLLFLEKELPEAKKLPKAKRIPYAPLAAELSESETLAECPEIPETLEELPPLSEMEQLPQEKENV